MSGIIFVSQWSVSYRGEVQIFDGPPATRNELIDVSLEDIVSSEAVPDTQFKVVRRGLYMLQNSAYS